MPPQSFSLVVVRPDDLLIVQLEFVNVQFTPPQPGQPGEIQGAANARLTVHLQPQHIAEQAFFQASQDHQGPPLPSDQVPLPPGLVQSRLAGPSRLVFRVPAGETIPFTLEGVLDALQRLPLAVSAVASYELPGCLDVGRWVAARPEIRPPAPGETAIEAPYRLILSPDDLATWTHALAPVAHADWVELWHTRLGSTRRDGDPRVRAIWSPDFRAGAADVPQADPFLMSLNRTDRNQIVHLTSNYTIPGYAPKHVDTERFMLSSLGAWLEVDGTWDPPQIDPQEPATKLIVERWRHEAMMGRDQYVRVVYRGYLYPYGHRAVLVKVTERKFFYREDVQKPGLVAYLYQRKFIVVREPTRSYGPRDLPLRTVTFKTRATPNLVDPAGNGINGLGDKAFWPQIDVGDGPIDFQFHLTGTDWEGKQVEWTAPLIFVDENADLNNVADIVTEYNVTHGVEHARRERPFSGQSISFAPANKAGDTAFEVVGLSLEGIELTGGGGGPHFRPAMAQAKVDVPAVRQLLGKGAPSTIVWEPSFLSGSGSGIGNKGDVFVKLIGTTALEFATEKVGGMVAPDLGISGLSRSLGPVGGPVDQMVAGEFRPQDIFGTVQLLGGITLADIVKMLDFDLPDTTGGKIPGLTVERLGDRIVTRYVWTISVAEMISSELFEPAPSSTFALQAVVTAPLDGSPPTFDIGGSLTDFTVNLLPGLTLVRLTFSSVSFKALPGEKPDVTVELGGIEFGDVLEFVQELQRSIPLDGFGSGPYVELAGAPDPGVNVGFTLGIPTISVGVMSIQNITLTAAVFLPFGDAELNFHFGFCERQQPFLLTVMIFGGGGFFSIDIGLSGVKLIEAALEFGLAAAINLGVASGKASMTAGFYFQMAGADFELTGYFRAYGELSVLGIISVSLEFYLGLSYASKGMGGPHAGTLWGQASLTIKIEILFFSTSVSVSMEREFAGSDPTFRDMLAPADWQQYATAFAPYP